MVTENSRARAPEFLGPATFAVAALVLTSAAMAQQESNGSANQDWAPPAVEADTDQMPGLATLRALSDNWHGRMEIKRQNTARGTPDESTLTQLRIETFFDGPVASLRLDLPLPDEKTDFEGDLFNPRLGDVKFRARFRPLKSGEYTFPTFLEMAFPTADPKSSGSGKYQLSGGIRMVVPFTLPVAQPKDHKAQFETELSQTVSVAGDEGRQDVNYTKFEFTFYDVWRGQYTMKVKLKPSVDWMKDGKTGSVGEVEAGLFFARHWRTWLMVGHRLSGPDGIKGTYDTRIELGLARTF
jgi:hypothetical protein